MSTPRARNFVVKISLAAASIIAFTLFSLSRLGYSEYAEGLAAGISEPSDHTILQRLHFNQFTLKGPSSIVKENMELYRKFLNSKISEPKGSNLIRPLDDVNEYQRANATIVVLARNSDVGSVLFSVKEIERVFNSKYHYPVVFLNDKPFSSAFIRRLTRAVSGKAFFEKVDEKDWNKPDFINDEKYAQGISYLKEKGIGYANKESYHNMCRYYSGKFYNHPRLQQYKWYWRFEPGTRFFCDIDYDVFKFMESSNNTYGFTINLYDAEHSLTSIWPKTLDFVKRHPHYVNPNGSFKWLTENLQCPEKTKTTQGYSTCHFWSNFEIGNMDFFRGEAYSEWFDMLDKDGGFYYERWGDAPVHSIGLGLFEDKNKIHWFRDIGYEHNPYFNCPNSDKCKGCRTARFGWKHLENQNCMGNWIKYSMDEKGEIY